MKKKLIYSLASCLLFFSASQANDLKHKLAYSKEYQVDIFVKSESYCEQNVAISVVEKSESSIQADNLSVLNKKLGQLLSSQCPEAEKISLSLFDVNNSLRESYESTKQQAWAMSLISEANDSKVADKMPEAVIPEVVAPEVVAPEVVAPEVVAPEVVAPEVVAPEAVAPEVVTPEVVAPEVVAPEVVAPEVVTPEAVTPEAVTPEAVAPEVVTPEVVTPEAVTPEAVTPEAVTPEAVAPEVVAPEVVAPEVVAPEVVAPEVVAPEVVAPEVVAPEVVAPEVVAPEVVAPEVVAPEVVAPEVVIDNTPMPESQHEPFYYDTKDYLINNKNKNCQLRTSNDRIEEELDFLYFDSHDKDKKITCENNFISGENNIDIKYVDGRIYTSKVCCQFVNGFLMSGSNVDHQLTTFVSRYAKEGWGGAKWLVVKLGTISNPIRSIYGFYDSYGTKPQTWRFNHFVVQDNNEDRFLDQAYIASLATQLGSLYDGIRIDTSKDRHVYGDFYVVDKLDLSRGWQESDLLYKSRIEKNNKSKVWKNNINSARNYAIERQINRKKIQEQERLEAVAEVERVAKQEQARKKQEAQQKIIDEERAKQALEQQAQEQKERLVRINKNYTWLKDEAHFFERIFFTHEDIFKKLQNQYGLPKLPFEANNQYFNGTQLATLYESALFNSLSWEQGQSAVSFRFFEIITKKGKEASSATLDGIVIVDEDNERADGDYLVWGTAIMTEDNIIEIAIEEAVQCEKKQCEEYKDSEFAMRKVYGDDWKDFL